MIARHFEGRLGDYPHVVGIAAFVHGTGCGLAGSGEQFDTIQRVMWGYACHPNCAGVLMVGLGCEVNQTRLLRRLGDEAHLNLARLLGVGLELPLRADVPAEDDSFRRLVHQHPRPTKDRALRRG